MNKLIACFGLVSLFAAGCATSHFGTEDMYGGLVDDHAATVAACGVGNYKFRYLKEPCTPNVEAVTAARGYRKIDIADVVTFERGSADITASGKEILDEVASTAQQKDQAISKINIEGYADYTGTSAMNLALSQARADSVREYLANKGVDTRKMEVKAYGESQSRFGPGASKADLSGERRVGFEIEPSAQTERQ